MVGAQSARTRGFDPWRPQPGEESWFGQHVVKEWMFVYMCVCVCANVCVYIGVYTCVCVYVNVCVCVCV